MDLKGGAPHSRTGGDRPWHGHQGGDSSDEQPWMVSGFDSQDGGGSGNWPCRRACAQSAATPGGTPAPPPPPGPPPRPRPPPAPRPPPPPPAPPPPPPPRPPPPEQPPPAA